MNARGERLRLALDEVAETAGMHVSGRGSLMTVHPARAPTIASTPLTGNQAAARSLVFFGLVERGFWLARRGMLSVSLPITDAMCHDLVAAFADVLETHREAFAELA